MNKANFSLPNGWQWKRLGEAIMNVQSGFACNQKFEISEGTVHLRTHNISTSGKLNFDKLVKIQPDKVQKGLSSLQKGDVLFNNTNSVELVGKTALVEEDLNYGFSNHLTLIKTKECLYPNFLVSYFNNLLNQKFFESICNRWIGQAGINTKALLDIQIPIPTPNEQHRIVAKIDAAFVHLDEAIILQKENLERTREMKEKVLNEVFNKISNKYEQVKLSFFGRIVSGGTPSRRVQEYWGGDINWFTSGELNFHTIQHSKEKITELGLENSNAKVFEKGTLLIGMYDTAALKMSILDGPATCNQAIVGIKPDNDILNIYFLKYQLEFLRPSVLQQRQGVRQQNLNAQKIKDIMISFPPLKEQHKIGAYLGRTFTQIDTLQQEQQQRLAHLEDLKKSILEEAFQGKL